MQYATIGRTGIAVSRFSLGSVPFRMQVDRDTSIRMLDRAFDLGVNFLNTAAIYEDGAAEEFIGAWMQGKPRHQVVVGTTFKGRVGQGPNDRGGSRLHIFQQVDLSLRRLRTDYIDLYQMHAPDLQTPIETTLRTLDDLVHQGKVRAIGCSNFEAWRLCKALWTSDVRNLERFEAIQNRYNLLARELELEMLPLCASEQVGVTVYNPLAGGLLSGKHSWSRPPVPGSRFDTSIPARQYREFRIGEFYHTRYWHEVNFEVVERLKGVAVEGGRSLVQYALAWVLANPAVASAVAGATSIQQLEETVAAVDKPLTTEEWQRGNEASVGAISPPAIGPRND